MKKLPILLSALLMTVLFAACGDANDDAPASNTRSVTEESVASVEESVVEAEISEFDLSDFSPYGTEGATKIIISPDDFGEMIPNFEFAGNKELTHVYIMDGITEIGIECFSFCTSLEFVRLPDTLKENGLGMGAFCDCPALESITIPGGMKYIPYEAFARCGIKKAVIEEGIEGLGRPAFFCCPLEEISLPSTLIYLTNIPVKTLDLPDNITDIEYFNISLYESVTIKEDSTTFKTFGFSKDSLPDNVHLK